MDDVQRLGGRVVLLDQGKVLVDAELDRLPDEYCLAIIPNSCLTDPETIRLLPGCLRVRRAFEDWHAVFAESPESARGRIGLTLGRDDIECTRLTLEDLFIELVGGERRATVA